MAPEEIDKLLESPNHEVRAGGLSIMDKQARGKRTPEKRRKELFDLYLRRTDRINNWDLVNRSRLLYLPCHARGWAESQEPDHNASLQSARRVRPGTGTVIAVTRIAIIAWGRSS